MFNPTRLSIARERRAVSNNGLAEKVGVTPNTIHRYESGEISPSEESLALLASALSFPKSFFLGADLDKPRRANASFRGLASKSARVMDAALASGAMAYLVDDWILDRYSQLEPDLLIIGGTHHITTDSLCRQN